MAFPNNPSNGDTFVRYGRTYQYDSTMLMWKVLKSGILLEELADIDITTNPPTAGDALVWSGTKFVPDEVNILSAVYQSDLPLSGNTAGDMAYVTSTNRIYIFTGAGWYNIALINTNPTITVGPDGSYVFATDGTPIVLTLEAQDPEELPIAWSYVVTSGVLGSTATVQQEGNVFTITPSTDGNDAGEFSITFTASDGVNLATAVSSFTLAFGSADQYYNSTSLLVKSGSTAGLNNNTFVDESTNSFTVTPTGDVYQGSLSPYSPAGWSGYFDGTGDSLVTPSNAAFAFGTGDFTIEMWVYIPTNTGTYQLFYNSRNNGTGFTFGLNLGGLKLMYYNGGILTSDPTNLTLNQWTHVALVRNAGTTRIYRNGVVVGTPYADSINYTSTVTEIGRDVAFSFDTRGFISNVRIVKGTAVYTSNFTPPTGPLTAISGTSLLTCQSNRFIDNSTNNFTITRAGDVSVQSFSPFIPLEHYDPTVHGGSAYFDGTGDYLQVGPDVAFGFGTGDFTFEAWVYAKVSGTTMVIADVTLNTATMYVHSSNRLHFYANSTAYDSGLTVISNAWNHVAWVRSSGSLRMYVNGVGNSAVSMTTNLGSNEQMRVGVENTAYWNGYISNFRAVKGTAVYTADFTPPTQRLTAISGTSLLLNMNNAGIYDEISKNNIKMVGNTTTSTTQTKYSDTSVYFDGAADWIDLYSENLILSSAFTIEAWVFLSSSQSNQTLVNMAPPHNTLAISLNRSGTGRTYVYIGNGSSWTGVPAINSGSGNTIAINQWYHVALTSDGTTLRLFHNGIIVGTSTTLPSGMQGYARIGAAAGVAASEYFNGYMEDFRITKDVARYTANFTPPTAALGFSNAE